MNIINRRILYRNFDTRFLISPVNSTHNTKHELCPSGIGMYVRPSDENWIYDILYYYKTRAKDDCMPIFGHELALRYRLELTGDIANPVLFVGVYIIKKKLCFI